MRGSDLIRALKRKYRVSTDTALAKHLGVSLQSIQNWKGRKTLTALQVATLVHKSSFNSNVIRPIVEFLEVEQSESRNGAGFEILAVIDADGSLHPYYSAIKDELNAHHGVYIFFDSRGRAIYTGKARKQTLWREMNLAYNRDRGNVQSVYRVKHPTNHVEYKAKPRQINREAVALHEMARYVSAYHVPDAMINDLETMLVRSFANDLLNVRMEKFKQ
jgi:hypothetical protein